jgi:oligosaccharide repeat unit polymerase
VKFLLVALAITVAVILMSRMRRALAVPLLMLLAWTPALLLSAMPFTFTSGYYSFMNRGVSGVAYLVFILMFLSVAVGAYIANGSRPRRQSVVPYPHVNELGLWMFFLAGLMVYSVSYALSGLGDTLSGQSDAMAVVASRDNFYLGTVNHLILFLDLTSVIFFLRYIDKRKLIYLLPVIITIAAYLLTYQKARVINIVVYLVFVGTLYPHAMRRVFMGNPARRAASLGAFVLMGLGLIWTNTQRGIDQIDVMTYSPLLEQLFIYSGAPALLNMSATLDGVLPSGEPQYGLTMLRGFIWSFVDRSQLSPTAFFEGINNGTILVYWWHDFRWAGVLLVPFLFGFLTTRMMLAARSGRIFSLVAGATACVAVVMSIYTDVISEATTIIYLFLAFVMDRALALRRRRSARLPMSKPPMVKTGFIGAGAGDRRG